MMSLKDMEDGINLPIGTLIRIYDAHRFDVMKHQNDYLNFEKQQQDFYDYLLVDIHAAAQNTFILVNVTPGNNRGHILCIFQNINTRGSIEVKIIKAYFEGNLNVFILNDGDSNL